MRFFSKHEASPEAVRLVESLTLVSSKIIDEAEAHAWREHEAGRMSDQMFFIVVRRLQELASMARKTMTPS